MKTAPTPARGMQTAPALARGMKRLRKKHGLTQAALAERIDVGVQFVSQLERARRTPSIETLDAIATVFRVTPWELLAAGADADELQARPKDVLATRVRDVVEAWPENARAELLDILRAMGRLARTSKTARGDDPQRVRRRPR